MSAWTNRALLQINNTQDAIYPAALQMDIWIGLTIQLVSPYPNLCIIRLQTLGEEKIKRFIRVSTLTFASAPLEVVGNGNDGN